MSETVNEPDTYSWAGDRAEEERRLIAQSRLLEGVTEELLRQAGLGEGMHVVELGSGAGDVAILAARLVGPTGSVLGIERSPEQLELAWRRIADMGIHNVTLREGDVAALGEVLSGHTAPIDAVIGRLILTWVPERIAMLATCAKALKPGTLLWFLEPDMRYDYAIPSTPLWDQLRSWVVQAVEGVGAETRMGPRLHQAFRSAGLPAPVMETRTIMAGPEAAPVWFWVNIVRALLPVMEKLGLTTAAEVDLDTLETRLTADLAANDAVMIVCPVTAAWVRIPA